MKTSGEHVNKLLHNDKLEKSQQKNPDTFDSLDTKTVTRWR